MNEIIEHKGKGHPDSITDYTVESCASLLDKYYFDKYGKILHYNVDKALFLAGDVRISFGGGDVIKKPCFILGGQISELTEELNLLLKKNIKETINSILPNLNDFDIEIRSNNVSKNLSNISDNSIILSNDTSFNVGYYPFSNNEQIVLKIRDKIEEIIKNGKIPIGEDFKIMFSPQGIVVSAPLYANKIKNEEEYKYYKTKIIEELSQFGNIIFNPDSNNGFYYMTLCGSSVECGDDGQVGRGNRYNGLITPNKPMTIEAYHGKNNKNHTGKLYTKRAFEKAKEIYDKTGNYTEVFLVSKIGEDINRPECYIESKKIL
jgi:S-adenosylmethionine synthetase